MVHNAKSGSIYLRHSDKRVCSKGEGNKNKCALIVLDQAGWHSKNELPAGIELEFLPSYSPELQPAERLWELTDDPLVNKCFKNLDDLEAVLKKVVKI